MSKYFWGGFRGALLLIIIMYGMKYAGYAGDPGYIGTYYTVIDKIGPIFDQVMAGVLFALSGGIWGVLFGIVSGPSPLKGMLFGLAPTLWLWVVVMPFSGGEFFGNFEQNAILMPLFFNCVVWGTYLGWTVSR